MPGVSNSSVTDVLQYLCYSCVAMSLLWTYCNASVTDVLQCLCYRSTAMLLLETYCNASVTKYCNASVTEILQCLCYRCIAMPLLQTYCNACVTNVLQCPMPPISVSQAGFQAALPSVHSAGHGRPSVREADSPRQGLLWAMLESGREAGATAG